MRHVKKPSFFSCMEMFFEDAHWILHRHIIARKWHHFCAKRFMFGVKCGLFEIRHRWPFPRQSSSRTLSVNSATCCPFGPERLTMASPKTIAYSVGGVFSPKDPLSSVLTAIRSRDLSVSGAVAPSVVGLFPTLSHMAGSSG